jgi:MerR family copper efflux transcriptional regulator
MRRQTTPTMELSEAREHGFFNIGEAAAASGVSAKMIRHYEKIGLVPEVHRTWANYRIYSQAEVHTLQFVRRARRLGFSIPQIKTLLGLWQDKQRKSSDIKRIAQEHVRELDTMIGEMQAMRRTLRHLAEHCHGDERPECPILDDLAGLHPEGDGPTDAPASPAHRHPPTPRH